MQSPVGQENPGDFIRSFSGDNRFILDYLAEEVLARQPLSTRQFLLQTSILRRLCGPLCDAVTGGENGVDVLAELERANLFIVPLDDKRQWVRYGHLFADLLTLFLQRDHLEEIPALNSRAARWYKANGFPGEAVQHALAASDYDWAADLVQENGLSLLQRGELFTLRGWLEALPDDICRERPWLQIYYAWTLLLSGQRDLVDRHLDQAAVALDDGRDESDERRALGHITAIRAYKAAFDEDFQRAISAVPSSFGTLPQEEMTVRSVVAYTLGGISYMSGDMTGAMAETKMGARELGLV